MKIKWLSVCLFSLTFSLFAFAHTDTILQQENGSLIGLPEKYAPAKFNWEKKVLRVGDYLIDLNAFENIIPMYQDYEITITSSWYHKSNTLPPYIGIVLKPKDRTFNYTILLNIDNLELIKVSLDYRIHKERCIACPSHELKIREYDLKQIKSRTRKVR